MTDAATNTAFAARIGARRDRQARVGILRNPNSPPAPPARRVALTGKWMRLRSTRRPSTRSAPQELEGVEPVPFVTEGGMGPRINLEALQKTVAGLSANPQRRPFAQGFRPGLPLANPAPQGQRAAVEPGQTPPRSAVEPETLPGAGAEPVPYQPGRPIPHVGAILFLLAAASLWVFLLRLAGP